MKTLLFIWQLGVNIIGLPELLKVSETRHRTESIYMKNKTIKTMIYERNNQNNY